MGFTLIDFFNGFQTLKQSKKFSAGAQSTYFAILAEFNSAHFPTTLPISIRALQNNAGLKSVSTTHECRNVLKNHKLIDFEARRDITVYRLLTEHLSNTKTVSAEHQPNGKRTPRGLFAIPCAWQSSPQTPFKETETLKDEEDASARTRLATETQPFTDAYALPLKSSSYEEDIQEEWTKRFGYSLRGNNALELLTLASKDYERALEAIKRTSKVKNLRDPFSYFKTVYDDLKPTKTMRGGEKNERPREYEHPKPLDPELEKEIAEFDF